MALMNRASIKERLKDYESAIEDYDYTLKLNLYIDFLYTARGKIKYLLGDVNGALADSDHAKKLQRIIYK